MSGREHVQAGLFGEWRAMCLLKRKGMKLLAWRYRAAGGEVDLVVQDGQSCVFVEVKYRKNGQIGDGLHAVNGDKRRRIRQAARHYLASHDFFYGSVRFDVVEISRAGVHHIRNAF